MVLPSGVASQMVLMLALSINVGCGGAAATPASGTALPPSGAGVAGPASDGGPWLPWTFPASGAAAAVATAVCRAHARVTARLASHNERDTVPSPTGARWARGS